MLRRALRAVIVIGLLLAFDFSLLAIYLPYGPYVRGGLAMAFLVAQVGLCATWLSIGRDPPWISVPGTVILGVGIWQFLEHWNDRAIEELAPGLLVQVVVVVPVLWFLRFNRFELGEGALPVAVKRAGPVPRFLLRDLMAATAVMGAATAVLLRMTRLNAQNDASSITAISGVFLGALTVLAVLSILTLRYPPLGAGFTCVASVLLGWSISRAVKYDEHVAISAFAAQAVLQVVVLGGLRIVGYRFGRNVPGNAGAAQDLRDSAVFSGGALDSRAPARKP